MSKTEYFTHPADYFRVVCDETNELLDVSVINDLMMRVKYAKVCWHLYY